jgi:hypothetical protein
VSASHFRESADSEAQKVRTADGCKGWRVHLTKNGAGKDFRYGRTGPDRLQGEFKRLIKTLVHLDRAFLICHHPTSDLKDQVAIGVECRKHFEGQQVTLESVPVEPRLRELEEVT